MALCGVSVDTLLHDIHLTPGSPYYIHLFFFFLTPFLKKKAELRQAGMHPGSKSGPFHHTLQHPGILYNHVALHFKKHLKVGPFSVMMSKRRGNP